MEELDDKVMKLYGRKIVEYRITNNEYRSEKFALASAFAFASA